MPWKVLCRSTRIGRLVQVSPWSLERITLMLKPRRGGLFVRF
jgi:hypothetical protein